MIDDWTPVYVRNPEKDGKYLICCVNDDQLEPLITVGWYNSGHGWSPIPNVFVGRVRFWMPLPLPPKYIGERHEYGFS